MSDMNFRTAKELIEKAVKLLNDRKGTDLLIRGSIMPFDSDGATVDLYSPTKFANAAVKHFMPLSFSNNWFDPDETVATDLHADYGALKGGQKVLARLILAIYVVWLGDGSTYAGIHKLDDLKKKASD